MKKIIVILSFLAVLPLLACSCVGVSIKPANTMSNSELSREYETLSRKQDRKDAMYTAYEWNRFNTNLGTELSSRDNQSTPPGKLAGQYNRDNHENITETDSNSKKIGTDTILN